MNKTVKLNEKEMKAISKYGNGCDDDCTMKAMGKVLTKIDRELDKKPIKVASRKAKGRNLQKWAVEKIAGLLGEPLIADADSNNIRSREMGQSGVDVWLHKSLRGKFPVAVECKAQEHITLPAFIEQAKSNISNDMSHWLLVIKNKAIKNPVAIMDWELLEWLYRFKQDNN